jgi:hypothetical protein
MRSGYDDRTTSTTPIRVSQFPVKQERAGPKHDVFVDDGLVRMVRK